MRPESVQGDCKSTILIMYSLLAVLAVALVVISVVETYWPILDKGKRRTQGVTQKEYIRPTSTYSTNAETAMSASSSWQQVQFSSKEPYHDESKYDYNVFTYNDTLRKRDSSDPEVYKKLIFLFSPIKNDCGLYDFLKLRGKIFFLYHNAEKRLKSVTLPFFAHCDMSNVFTLYYQRLDELETLWKKRQDKDSREEAKELALQIINFFPILWDSMKVQDYTLQIQKFLGTFGICDCLWNETDWQDKKYIDTKVRQTVKEMESSIKAIKNNKTNLANLHCPAYERLISLYLQDEEYKKAINICNIGITRKDRTTLKGGFEAKRDRICKKMEKSKATSKRTI